MTIVSGLKPIKVKQYKPENDIFINYLDTYNIESKVNIHKKNCNCLVNESYTTDNELKFKIIM